MEKPCPAWITALGCAVYCSTTVSQKSRENSCELSVGNMGTIGTIITMNPDAKYIKVKVTNLLRSLRAKWLGWWYQYGPYTILQIETKYNTGWKGQSFHTYSDSVFSKGVPLYFRENFNVKIDNVKRAIHGRKILINVEFNRYIFSSINIYFHIQEAKNRNFSKTYSFSLQSIV